MTNFAQRKEALKAAAEVVPPEYVLKAAEWLLEASPSDESPEDSPEEVDPENPRRGWIIRDSYGDFWKFKLSGRTVERFYLVDGIDTEWDSGIPMSSLDLSCTPYTYVCPVEGFGLDRVPEGWRFHVESDDVLNYFWRDDTLHFFVSDGSDETTFFLSSTYQNPLSREHVKFTVLDRNIPKED